MLRSLVDSLLTWKTALVDAVVALPVVVGLGGGRQCPRRLPVADAIDEEGALLY